MKEERKHSWITMIEHDEESMVIEFKTDIQTTRIRLFDVDMVRIQDLFEEWVESEVEE